MSGTSPELTSFELPHVPAVATKPFTPFVFHDNDIHPKTRFIGVQWLRAAPCRNVLAHGDFVIGTMTPGRLPTTARHQPCGRLWCSRGPMPQPPSRFRTD
jgi:hypothetical protein